MFWIGFFKENSSIKKSVEQSQNRRYLYFETLALVLHWHCGDNVKYEFLSKHLSQRKLQYGGKKNLQVMTNLYKTHDFQLRNGVKKIYRSKLYLYNMHTGAGADSEIWKGGRSMSATMVSGRRNFSFQMV